MAKYMIVLATSDASYEDIVTALNGMNKNILFSITEESSDAGKS